MVEAAIGLILAGVGVWAFWSLVRMLQGIGRPRPVPEPSADGMETEIVRPEGQIADDGIVYMFADRFVQQAPRRALGSLPRDRAFDLTSGIELDTRDFAQQLVYATFIDLYTKSLLRFKLVPRDASFMPPFPNKSWALHLQQLERFPTSPLCDSLNVAFEMIYKQRLKKKQASDGDDSPDDVWVSLEDVLETALKAMRQEMSFWERGCIYSDLRNYVGIGLTAQGYLLASPQDTWLDRIRRKPPVPNPVALEEHDLKGDTERLLKRIEAFRTRFGSASASADPGWPTGDVDPALLQPQCPLEDLPLDDCLRVSIYEALISIRQLEPSGEAGV